MNLLILIQDSAKYSDVCEQVLRWDRAQHKWTNLVQTDDVNAVSMEIDCMRAKGIRKGRREKAKVTTKETLMSREVL